MTGTPAQRILIVDDEPANLRLLTTALRKTPHVMIGATNGPDALRIATEPPPPDLILLDIIMPEMDGYTVIRTLKADPRTWNIPVIFVTSRRSSGDETEAFRLGAVDYITKPFSLPAVRARVATHLELKRHRDQLEQLVAEQTEAVRLQQRQLIQADKMAALGTLISGVAHEINNPNAFILSRAQVLESVLGAAEPILEAYYRDNGDFLLGGLDYSELRGNLSSLGTGIVSGAIRIKTIVNELRRYAQPSDGDMAEVIDINTVIQSAVTLLSNMIRKSAPNLTLCYGDKLPWIQGNFQRLEQVFINIIQNACQALPSPDRGIWVTTEALPSGNQIRVMVRDEGVGIPDEVIHRVTDPFFTTKRESGGTGLGLAISETIVAEHGGHLEVASPPGAGTTVTVRLPGLGHGGDPADTEQSNG